ncbi:cysteine sulfinic acid decarboxylase-like isoform X1 [Macrobrachium rosenbergii]|uniref:cysteine sulfinic acid decarboxylase-like isoform X1 n=1 Tax=Macrobrachium rosenbergii TaxID=79674 RepID=UPI0034D759A8
MSVLYVVLSLEHEIFVTSPMSFAKMFRITNLLRRMQHPALVWQRHLTLGSREDPLNREMDGKFLHKVLSLVLEENLVTGVDESAKVVEFKHPRELQELLKLNVGQNSRSTDEIMKVLEEVVRYSVKTTHPHFYNQLYGGIDEIGLAASWLSSALNTNQHTFEVAPVFILVEHYIIEYLVKLFGWDDGDGIFCPGGSMSNMYGMQLARHQRYPQSKATGIFGMKPLIAFTSDQAHYSFEKAASWMGLGMNNVVAVATDSHGRMLPEALSEAVKHARKCGGEPFFVNASSGTTVLGACDPLNQLADVCEEEQLWLHVDACWGGSAILSQKHKHLLQGIHRVDSIAWNPHKMLGVPLQCSSFIVRHKGMLHECNSANASYLFQQDKFYDVSFDTGDKSFQCGRKVDAFKFYFLLSSHGLSEMERRVDAAFSASEYLHDQIQTRPGFRAVLDAPQCTNVCFWYIPTCLRHQPETPEWWNRLSQVAPKLKAKMVENGELMIGYQPMPNKGLVNFLRVVNYCFPPPTKEHMDHVLDVIQRLGEEIKNL